ncbi:MAG TPA: hypothetical protein PLO93_07475, partial [Candidatus Omnitrophota bacterium]|nr:hypothetical protein [Candidatus Omnitrophota bacterium]
SVTAPEISTHPSAITITRRPNRQTKAQSTDETTEELHQKKTLSASKETAHSLASEISEFVPGPGITKSNNRPTENEVQEMIKSGVVVW